jgi:hypothetical protein
MTNGNRTTVAAGFFMGFGITAKTITGMLAHWEMTIATLRFSIGTSVVGIALARIAFTVSTDHNKFAAHGRFLLVLFCAA